MPTFKITEPRILVEVRPNIRRNGGAVSPGAMVVAGKGRTFVHYRQLREVADALHDICDELEQADNGGRMILAADE